ncbi:MULTISPECIES: ketopantoate reductase family protein [unclassified Rhodococcus (in: high G+C Gram-positive bacteria)]|uniref:ketopantoate reductase family protein n=1 Tax=unclassified Rhodococcus (in: high G+C Gram-positive bacteria) TaxID=192944 RepID=UPI001C52ECAB|nr:MULTISPECIES: 2-dehydropantoate 2-reductase [unclassified Rhodococcus (in: high G+C Gram-positive bacteria)]
MTAHRYTVVGAGAIGGTLATYLHDAGCPVQLVDADVAHVEAIRARGLELRTPQGTRRTEIPAFTLDDAPEELGAVLLAVKTQATAGAVNWIAPRLSHEGFVVSMQNGMNEELIASIVGPERTVAAFVDLFADVVEPGVVVDGGAGAIALGEYMTTASNDRVQGLAHDLRLWGEPIVSTNVNGYLWSKLGFAAMLIATAVADVDMSELVDRHRPAMNALVAEVFDIARTQEVTLESFDAFDPSAYRRDASHSANKKATDALVQWLSRQSKTRSGVWRDIAVKKRPTEVRPQYEPVLAIADREGIAAPALRRLLSLIDQLENGTLEMSEQHLADLDSLVATQPQGAQ